MQKIESRYGRMLALGFLATALSAVAAGAEDVVRTPLPDGNPFPISAAVTVRPPSEARCERAGTKRMFNASARAA